MAVDLHLHTTASDGSLSPSELVQEAIKVGFKTIAITDHDTTDGLDEGIEAGRTKGLQVIPGVEISTDWHNTEVHMLGYFMDYHNSELQETLTKFRNGRFERARLMVEKLGRLGYKIDFDRVREIAKDGSIGRPHVASALVEKGLVYDIQDAFKKLIGRHGPAYVPRYKLTPVEAVKVIVQAKGLAVMAHPGLSRDDSIIPVLVEAGMVGIEVWHSDHDERQIEHYKELAEKLEIIPTAGSDWHGPSIKQDIRLGELTGEDWIVERLTAARNR